MRRRDFMAAAGASLVVAHANAQDRLPRLGVLWFVGKGSPFELGLLQGLRELGYSDGRNIQIISRYAEGNSDRLSALVAELVAHRLDVLFVSSRALNAARQGAPDLPVVCAGFSDPVAEGFAASLARPGGNFTGLSWRTAETSAKRLDYARALIPSLKGVAVLVDPKDPQTSLEYENVRVAAGRLGLGSQALEFVGDSRERDFLDNVVRAKPQALFVSDFPLAVQYRERICRVAIANRIAIFGETNVFVEAGALLSYGADGVDMFRRAGGYIDRLFKGAKAGDLPIEQPNKFVLTLGLRAARELGIAVPESIRIQAERIVD